MERRGAKEIAKADGDDLGYQVPTIYILVLELQKERTDAWQYGFSDTMNAAFWVPLTETSCILVCLCQHLAYPASRFKANNISRIFSNNHAKPFF